MSKLFRLVCLLLVSQLLHTRGTQGPDVPSHIHVHPTTNLLSAQHDTLPSPRSTFIPTAGQLLSTLHGASVAVIGGGIDALIAALDIRRYTDISAVAHNLRMLRQYYTPLLLETPLTATREKIPEFPMGLQSLLFRDELLNTHHSSQGHNRTQPHPRLSGHASPSSSSSSSSAHARPAHSPRFPSGVTVEVFDDGGRGTGMEHMWEIELPVYLYQHKHNSDADTHIHLEAPDASRTRNSQNPRSKRTPDSPVGLLSVFSGLLAQWAHGNSVDSLNTVRGTVMPANEGVLGLLCAVGMACMDGEARETWRQSVDMGKGTGIDASIGINTFSEKPFENLFRDPADSEVESEAEAMVWAQWAKRNGEHICMGEGKSLRQIWVRERQCVSVYPYQREVNPYHIGGDSYQEKRAKAKGKGRRQEGGSEEETERVNNSRGNGKEEEIESKPEGGEGGKHGGQEERADLVQKSVEKFLSSQSNIVDSYSGSLMAQEGQKYGKSPMRRILPLQSLSEEYFPGNMIPQKGDSWVFVPFPARVLVRLLEYVSGAAVRYTHADLIQPLVRVMSDRDKEKVLSHERSAGGSGGGKSTADTSITSGSNAAPPSAGYLVRSIERDGAEAYGNYDYVIVAEGSGRGPVRGRGVGVVAGMGAGVGVGMGTAVDEGGADAIGGGVGLGVRWWREDGMIAYDEHWEIMQARAHSLSPAQTPVQPYVYLHREWKREKEISGITISDFAKPIQMLLGPENPEITIPGDRCPEVGVWEESQESQKWKKMISRVVEVSENAVGIPSPQFLSLLYSGQHLHRSSTTRARTHSSPISSSGASRAASSTASLPAWFDAQQCTYATHHTYTNANPNTQITPNARSIRVKKHCHVDADTLLTSFPYKSVVIPEITSEFVEQHMCVRVVSRRALWKLARAHNAYLAWYAQHQHHGTAIAAAATTPTTTANTSHASTTHAVTGTRALSPKNGDRENGPEKVFNRLVQKYRGCIILPRPENDIPEKNTESPHLSGNFEKSGTASSIPEQLRVISQDLVIHAAERLEHLQTDLYSLTHHSHTKTSGARLEPVAGTGMASDVSALRARMWLWRARLTAAVESGQWLDTLGTLAAAEATERHRALAGDREEECISGECGEPGDGGGAGYRDGVVAMSVKQLQRAFQTLNEEETPKNQKTSPNRPSRLDGEVIFRKSVDIPIIPVLQGLEEGVRSQIKAFDGVYGDKARWSEAIEVVKNTENGKRASGKKAAPKEEMESEGKGKRAEKHVASSVDTANIVTKMNATATTSTSTATVATPPLTARAANPTFAFDRALARLWARLRTVAHMRTHTHKQTQARVHVDTHMRTQARVQTSASVDVTVRKEKGQGTEGQVEQKGSGRANDEEVTYTSPESIFRKKASLVKSGVILSEQRANMKRSSLLARAFWGIRDFGKNAYLEKSKKSGMRNSGSEGISVSGRVANGWSLTEALWGPKEESISQKKEKRKMDRDQRSRRGKNKREKVRRGHSAMTEQKSPGSGAGMAAGKSMAPATLSAHASTTLQLTPTPPAPTGPSLVSTHASTALSYTVPLTVPLYSVAARVRGHVCQPQEKRGRQNGIGKAEGGDEGKRENSYKETIIPENDLCENSQRFAVSRRARATMTHLFSTMFTRHTRDAVIERDTVRPVFRRTSVEHTQSKGTVKQARNRGTTRAALHTQPDKTGLRTATEAPMLHKSTEKPALRSQVKAGGSKAHTTQRGRDSGKYEVSGKGVFRVDRGVWITGAISSSLTSPLSPSRPPHSSSSSHSYASTSLSSSSSSSSSFLPFLTAASSSLHAAQQAAAAVVADIHAQTHAHPYTKTHLITSSTPTSSTASSSFSLSPRAPSLPPTLPLTPHLARLPAWSRNAWAIEHHHRHHTHYNPIDRAYAALERMRKNSHVHTHANAQTHQLPPPSAAAASPLPLTSLSPSTAPSLPLVTFLPMYRRSPLRAVQVAVQMRQHDPVYTQHPAYIRTPTQTQQHQLSRTREKTQGYYVVGGKKWGIPDLKNSGNRISVIPENPFSGRMSVIMPVTRVLAADEDKSALSLSSSYSSSSSSGQRQRQHSFGDRHCRVKTDPVRRAIQRTYNRVSTSQSSTLDMHIPHAYAPHNTVNIAPQPHHPRAIAATHRTAKTTRASRRAITADTAAPTLHRSARSGRGGSDSSGVHTYTLPIATTPARPKAANEYGMAGIIFGENDKDDGLRKGKTPTREKSGKSELSRKNRLSGKSKYSGGMCVWKRENPVYSTLFPGELWSHQPLYYTDIAIYATDAVTEAETHTITGTVVDVVVEVPHHTPTLLSVKANTKDNAKSGSPSTHINNNNNISATNINTNTNIHVATTKQKAKASGHTKLKARGQEVVEEGAKVLSGSEDDYVIYAVIDARDGLEDVQVRTQRREMRKRKGSGEVKPRAIEKKGTKDMSKENRRVSADNAFPFAIPFSSSRPVTTARAPTPAASSSAANYTTTSVASTQDPQAVLATLQYRYWVPAQPYLWVSVRDGADTGRYGVQVCESGEEREQVKEERERGVRDAGWKEKQYEYGRLGALVPTIRSVSGNG